MNHISLCQRERLLFVFLCVCCIWFTNSSHVSHSQWVWVSVQGDVVAFWRGNVYNIVAPVCTHHQSCQSSLPQFILKANCETDLVMALARLIRLSICPSLSILSKQYDAGALAWGLYFTRPISLHESNKYPREMNGEDTQTWRSSSTKQKCYLQDQGVRLEHQNRWLSRWQTESKCDCTASKVEIIWNHTGQLLNVLSYKTRLQSSF